MNSIIFLEGDQAFSGISALRCVYWDGPIITTPGNILDESSSGGPCGAITYSDTIVGLYSGQGGITSVIISSTITSISETYLYLLSSNILTIIIISLLIGDNAFFKCASLSSVTLINGLTVISGKMFSTEFEVISSLKSITIVSSVTSIGLFSI